MAKISSELSERNVVTIVCSPLPPYIPFSVSGNIGDILGYGPGDLIGSPNFLIGLVRVEDVLQLLSGFFHLYIRGQHIYDYRVLKKNGTCKRMLLELQLIRDEVGNPNRILLFMTEPALFPEQSGKAEGRHRIAPFGKETGFNIEMDAAFRIRNISRSVEQILGYKPNVVIGGHLYDFILQDYQPIANAAIIRIIECCKNEALFWLAVNHQNGSLRYLDIEARGMNTDNERLVAATCRDITPLVQSRRVFVEYMKDLPLPFDRRAPESDMQAATDDAGKTLTLREREVLLLIARGKSNKEIADQLRISSRTVEAHRATIMRKLRIRSHAGLIHYAIRNNFLSGQRISSAS